MAEREQLLIQREEFLKQQSMSDEDGGKGKVELIKDEISKIEHQIMGLQQVR